VICDVYPHLVREDGMPAEMDGLYELEDCLVSEVDRGPGATYHTASVTGDGRRVIYFAHDREFQMKSILDAVRSDVADLSIATSFDFEVYRDFVTPTDLDKQMDGDRQVISNLQENGDECVDSRKIEFWFYGNKPALEKLVAVLTLQSFKVDHWLDDPLGVVLSRDVAPNFSTFSQLTPLLVEQADKCGVEYDGWETFVLRGDATPPPPSSKQSLFSKLFGQRKN
jgi:regulator of RNase E activity RraB